MLPTIIFILAPLLVLALLVIPYIIVKKQKAKALEEQQKKISDFFTPILPEIKELNQKFSNHLSFENGYFSNFQLKQWELESKYIFKKTSEYTQIDIKNLLPEEDANEILKFLKYHNNSKQIRSNYNSSFIDDEFKKYDEFFNNIEGVSLDKQQRKAIMVDEDNNLIIAGAGSGKTKTIVGKVNYIIDRYKVAPSRILLISFTKKSSEDLQERIKIKGLEVKTFHKFGKDVISRVEKISPSIFDESNFKRLIIKFFNAKMKESKFLNNTTLFFTKYLKEPKSQFDFHNQGEYIQYLKDHNFRTYKAINKKTFQMEVVKSIEECSIANFLLFNDIEYSYEKAYPYDTATQKYQQYRPDFTITQNGKTVYIEHFGISRNGDVPSWFNSDSSISAKEKYHQGMEWKRQIHKKNNTTLLETYSYEMYEGDLLEKLTQKLENAGIKLNPLSPEQIWKIIRKNAEDEVNSFFTLICTFITLMKSNNYSIDNLITKSNKIKNQFQSKRTKLFLKIITPIYDLYQNQLAERNEIDFSDMIHRACYYINDQQYTKKFDYIIIDEFQDISIGRYKLVKALKESNPICKLFCVGDDWQSIYRFTGSDIALFKNFEQYFGYTNKSKIETTYRFKPPLLHTSSNFIQKNPNQEKKSLKSYNAKKRTEIKIEYSSSDPNDDTQTVQNIFDSLILAYPDIDKKSLYILGRYNFDLDRLNKTKQVFKISQSDQKKTVEYTKYLSENQRTTLKAEFLTVHRSKGLEADIVILINCNSGKFGFPSGMSDDPVLNILLSQADQFENGEERRLFYVAMTRAKEKLYLVTNSSYKSKFITELETETVTPITKKCPQCKTADIVLRKEGTAKNGNKYKFFGCTNFLYGCTHTEIKWENSTASF